MSYLHLPRLAFFGRFLTDPSTINNDPEHFDGDRFTANYWQPGTDSNPNGWWNPNGSSTWQFVDVTVTGATYSDGRQCTEADSDPIIGARVSDANDRVAGKLVDLDCEQQMVTELWGLGLRVEVPGRSLGFGGALLVTAFRDLWQRFPQGRGDSAFCTVFQTVVNEVWWRDVTGSRALEELHAAFEKVGDGAALSIRMMTDAYDMDATSPWFTTGRLSGSIGVAAPDEPRRFVSGRRFDPPADGSGAGPSLSGGPAVVTAASDGRPAMLHVDLGNSLPTSSIGGPWADQGDIAMVVQPPGAPQVILGSVPYRDPHWYETTSGIVSVRLSDQDAATVANAPIAVVVGSQAVVALTEADDGIRVRADRFVFRMSPGDQATATLHATRFGVAAAGLQVSFALDPTNVQSQQMAGPIPGPITGVPAAALTVPASVVTDERGMADVVLTASDPGNPRGYIDGQVYGVTYGSGPVPPAQGAVSNPANLLNVLVWSGVTPRPEPTWMADIEPIFAQYARLYPVMRPIVDLSDYADVVRRRTLLLDAFSKPIEDPGYMPVTRDLSPAKRDMIVRWLQTCRYLSIDSVDDLVKALQRAIELEHATIPPYLCALYSIKPGRNVEIASILNSVVVEEMLHLTLIANLTASLGRGVDLGRPGFVPVYPCALPGGLVAGLQVHLRALSIEHVRDCFMAIERGGIEVEPVRGDVRGGGPTELTRCTIGWFYDEIERGLVALHEAGAITFGHAERQVTRWPQPGALAPIIHLACARAALATIRHQGEGFGPLQPEDGTTGELAHYFRFSEIVAGRRLVPHADGSGFSYDGERIPFDPDGVFPMADDPVAALLTPGTRAAVLADRFRHDYRSLLRALHRAFNGEPDTIGSAMSLMFAVSIGARALMEVPCPDDPTRTVGPTF